MWNVRMCVVRVLWLAVIQPPRSLTSYVLYTSPLEPDCAVCVNGTARPIKRAVCAAFMSNVCERTSRSPLSARTVSTYMLQTATATGTSHTQHSLHKLIPLAPCIMATLHFVLLAHCHSILAAAAQQHISQGNRGKVNLPSSMPSRSTQPAQSILCPKPLCWWAELSVTNTQNTGNKRVGTVWRADCRCT